MPNLPEITVTASRFKLTRGDHEELEVNWDSIVEIIAFKRDMFGYDVICLCFRVSENDDFIEVAEDFPGHSAFIQELTSRFALAENWWNDVAFPAFATNASTIWRAE
ncbi:MAG: hypothetical protein H8E66_27210 [Planctomycetes bacterium]|nr:hypothetical protein [Planctomycetota bacterium]